MLLQWQHIVVDIYMMMVFAVTVATARLMPFKSNCRSKCHPRRLLSMDMDTYRYISFVNDTRKRDIILHKLSKIAWHALSKSTRIRFNSLASVGDIYRYMYIYVHV